MAAPGRIALVLAAVGAAVVLFVVLRPDSAAEPQPATAPATSAPAEAATTEPAPATTAAATETAPAAPAVERIAVVFRGGRVVGGVQRPRITQGRRVHLVVRADVRDHVHLHGYDLLADVAPGRPATIRFRASHPGRFEVELEDRHLLVAELEVAP